MTTTETLEREIRALDSKIRNSLNTRRDHPTFGVTKAHLRTDLGVLTGLLIALRIARGDAPPVPGSLIAVWAAENTDVELGQLETAIRQS